MAGDSLLNIPPSNSWLVSTDKKSQSMSRSAEMDGKTAARENLRLAFAWQGKYLRAISGAEGTEMGKVLNNVGFIALLRGDFENAEAYLLRAMEVDPRFNEAASRNLAYLKSMRDIQNAETPRAQD